MELATHTHMCMHECTHIYSHSQRSEPEELINFERKLLKSYYYRTCKEVFAADPHISDGRGWYKIVSLWYLRPFGEKDSAKQSVAFGQDREVLYIQMYYSLNLNGSNTLALLSSHWISTLCSNRKVLMMCN